jgi:cell division protein FtsB
MDKITYRPDRVSSRNNRSESDTINSLMSSFIVKIAFLVLSFFMFYNVLHSIKITSQKLDILEQAEQEVNELRVKNLKLSIQLDEMKETSYLEVEARDRLNFSGEGEIVFVIPDSLLEKSKDNLELILNDNVVDEVESTWAIWKEWMS